MAAHSTSTGAARLADHPDATMPLGDIAPVESGKEIQVADLLGSVADLSQDRAGGLGGPVGPEVAIPTRRQRQAARRLQARKVTRIVRRVDPLSILAIAALFFLCGFLVLLGAAVLLWTVASNAGLIGGIEKFVRDAFALESFALDGRRFFQFFVLLGLGASILACIVAVLATVMFNLISDLVGGVRVTVVQEETIRPEASRR